ncbi:putative leucine-rich repeat-containing protein DDB_G0290503 [Mytilus edulis]|uniref:putative leucine-rich repeat-containing protein DDB_G0290503 n=1 Tax=Mytilus edulis TaxID=6550 RepID=UPI0039EE3330
MASPKEERKGKTKHPTIKDPETNQRNKTISSSTNDTEPNQRNTPIYSSTNDPDPNHEFSDNEENSPTVLQTSSKDRKEQSLGRASDVFTFKLSIPAVVFTMAVAVYIIRAQYEIENKFAVLMKYEEYLKKVKTLSEKVPILDVDLLKLEERLVHIDTHVVILQSKMTTTNDTLKNVEMRIKLTEGISSKLEVDLPQQQQTFIEITKTLARADNDISNFSKTIDSMNNETTDIKKKLEIAFQNQTSLNVLLNKASDKAEYVNTSVSEVHTVINEINKHLPTLENMNKSATLIRSSYQLLPLMQRSLEDNKVQLRDLEMEVNNTESRLKDLKESSESVSNAVSSAVEQQTNIEEQVKLSNEDITKLKQHISKTDDNLTHRLTKLSEDLETSKGKILEKTSELNTDISKTEVKIGSMVTKVDDYNGKLGHFKSNVDSLSKDVNKMKLFEEYTGPKVRELDIQVRNLQSQNTGLFQPINVCVALAFMLIGALFYMTYYRYDNGGTQFREHERIESHSTPPFLSQRAPSILDRIQRVPVFDNKVCVLSFYSETMNLHKQLVKSALATKNRGGNIEIIQHLVRRHEDILNIPGARYIFVFVDFNERNVILENPGQDLGDKKLVTVQAAQKLGADVFVTYVRDRGSNQLVPGNLYNQELSAFTSHQVLRGLESNQRCFSVYETFNNTQKESIVRSIS